MTSSTKKKLPTCWWNVYVGSFWNSFPRSLGKPCTCNSLKWWVRTVGAGTTVVATAHAPVLLLLFSNKIQLCHVLRGEAGTKRLRLMFLVQRYKLVLQLTCTLRVTSLIPQSILCAYSLRMRRKYRGIMSEWEVRGLRKLHNEELQYLHSSPNTATMIKLGMRWKWKVIRRESYEMHTDFLSVILMRIGHEA